MSKSLNNLRNVEKCDVDRVTLQRSHSVLNDERVIVVCGQKICYCGHRIHRSPEKKVLKRVSFQNGTRLKNSSTFSWNDTSLGRDEPRSISNASGSSSTFSGKLRSSQRSSEITFVELKRCAKCIASEGLSTQAVFTAVDDRVLGY